MNPQQNNIIQVRAADRPGPDGRLRSRLIRALAGSAAAVQRQNRRGSFLVIVVGTLALMSVFAIVYIAIGRGDVDQSASQRRNIARDDVAKQFQDYVGGIIADSTLAMAPPGDTLDPNTKRPLADQLTHRKTWDHPSTGWETVDDQGNLRPLTSKYFDPRGQVGDTPFLAQTDAIDAGLRTGKKPMQPFLNAIDWVHISNLAPDGRFVNLANLRKVDPVTKRPIQFEPDVSNVIKVTEMRKGLTLIDVDAQGRAVPTSALPYGGVSNPDVIAHWDSYQRGLFRPAKDTTRALGNQDNLLNSYADADGDGMLDSRWFELVDARELSRIKSPLDTSDRYRYVFAARVIDLSGLVNFTTAADFGSTSAGAPAKDAPAGVRPSDVDLRRLLTLEDSYPWGIGYDKIESLASATARDPAGASPDNYTLPLPGYDDAAATGAGSWAYYTLQKTISTGHVPGLPTAGATGPSASYANAADRAEMYNTLTGAAGTLAFDSTSSRYEIGSLFGSSDFLDLFTYRAGNNPDITSPIELVSGGRFWGAGGAARRDDPLRGNRGLGLEVPDRDPANRGVCDPSSMVQFATDVRHLLTPFSGARILRSTLVGNGIATNTLSDAELKIALEPTGKSDSAFTDALFHGYADALIPESANIPLLNGAVNVVTWPNTSASASEYEKIKFAHYGYTTPELGLRMVAHMGVNLAQAAGGGQAARPFTLIVDEAVRNGTIPLFLNIKGLNTDYPFKPNDVTQRVPKDMDQRVNPWAWWADGRLLDLGDNSFKPPMQTRLKSRLADSTLKKTDAVVPALNVYGVVPEPVLTAVAGFHVFTDTPSGKGSGDDDAGNRAAGVDYDDDGKAEGLCTIDNLVGVGNSDFLMQVIAFQLTNPFDTDIKLCPDIGTGVLQDRYEYYIDFNGYFFRLAALQQTSPADGTGDLQPVTLKAGESRVFFATSQSLADIKERWRNALLPPNDVDPIPLSNLTSWLRTQLKSQLGLGGPVGDPIWIEQMKFDSAGVGAGMEHAYTSQRVSYAGKFTDFKVLGAGVAGEPVPRSKDDKIVRLWRSLRTPRPADPAAPANAAETPKDPTDPLPPQYLINDQLVDRLQDPGSSTVFNRLGPTPVGVFRNSIEDAIAFAETNTSGQNYNHGLTITKFGVVHRNGTPGGVGVKGAIPAYLLESKWDGAGTSGLSVVNNQKTGPVGGRDVTDYSGFNGTKTFDEFVTSQGTGNNPVVPEIANNPSSASWGGSPLAGYTQHLVELAAGLKGQTLRLGDLLLPLAVGPEFNPIVEPGLSPEEQFEKRYLTFGESLALAMDYDQAPVSAPYSQIHNQLAALTDNGHLKLDEYAPFYDGQDTGASQGVFDIGTNDQRRGLGIPLALTVLENFRVLPSEFSSLTRPTMGLININTAPLAVLRTLPMLSPSTANWWWTGHGVTSDIAATVAAYRDKIEMPFRPGSRTPLSEVDYHEPTATPSQPKLLEARNYNTGVAGIRETPGFHSVGELMLARTNVDSPNSIDYLGSNNVNDARDGVNSIIHTSTGGPGGTVNQIPDDYEERLMVANGVLNSISVRSDVYAVWFLVNGYQKSDVQRADGQPLLDSDPMVPSIQRRFLMVLDRSNVTAKGQKPRVVLFKEIPL